MVPSQQAGPPPTYEEAMRSATNLGARHEVRPSSREQSKGHPNNAQIFLNVSLEYQDSSGQRPLLGGRLPDRDTFQTAALMLFIIALYCWILKSA